MSVERIKTICRIRPNANENIPSNLRIDSNQSLTLTHNGEYNFTFDKVCQPNISQKEFYDHNIKFVLPHILQGKNTTLICYGPTGSGKTYTMYGNVFKNIESVVHSARGSRSRRPRKRAKRSKFKKTYTYDSDDSDNKNSSGSGQSCRSRNTLISLEEREEIQRLDAKLLKSSGVVNRLIKDLLNMYYHPNSVENLTSCTIDISMLQLYNENLYDLLSVDNFEHALEMKDIRNRVSISKCTVTRLKCYNDFTKVLQSGRQRLKIAATSLNSTSSRSHTILYIQFKQYYELEGRSKFSKIMVVDLAGSEQIKLSKVEGENMTEAININKSLSMLGLVISQLTNNQKYIHYRDSKLTRLLKDSLGGSSKCVMVLNISQDPRLGIQTMSTLRFGERVKTVKNKTKVNLCRPLKWYIKQYNKLKREVEKYKMLYTKLQSAKSTSKQKEPEAKEPETKVTVLPDANEPESKEPEAKEQKDTGISVRDLLLLNMGRNRAQTNSEMSFQSPRASNYVQSEHLSVMSMDTQGMYSDLDAMSEAGSERLSDDIQEFVQASGLVENEDEQDGEHHQLFIIDQDVSI